ncbi:MULTISPECIES: hypothetical protein [Sphingobacterium]|uniref:hypothetical protein n=1 Tax=Sphingobacterium TaxID=28453 RepID=UPI0016039637|nr:MULTISPECIES: hypothetical protein [Sphingobacterium]MBB1645432.1 hypothetical protein [Sphingobacterium sp. UME9]
MAKKNTISHCHRLGNQKARWHNWVKGASRGSVRSGVYYTLDLCAIMGKFAEAVTMDIHIASNM